MTVPSNHPGLLNRAGMVLGVVVALIPFLFVAAQWCMLQDLAHRALSSGNIGFFTMDRSLPKCGSSLSTRLFSRHRSPRGTWACSRLTCWSMFEVRHIDLSQARCPHMSGATNAFSLRPRSPPIPVRRTISLLVFLWQTRAWHGRLRGFPEGSLLSFVLALTSCSGWAFDI